MDGGQYLKNLPAVIPSVTDKVIIIQNGFAKTATIQAIANKENASLAEAIELKADTTYVNSELNKRYLKEEVFNKDETNQIKDTLNTRINSTNTSLSNETSRATNAENSIINTINTNKPIWDDKYTKNETDNKIAAVVTNLEWKEAVNTFVDLATTYPNAEDGWTSNTKDTDITYRYDGAAWIPISANAIPKATSSIDGLMSKEDKIKSDTLVTTGNGEMFHANDGNYYSISSGHTIKSDSETFAQRKNLKFEGDGVTITDDPDGDSTLITISGIGSIFPNVKNLSASINNGATQATISFTNPTNDNIEKIYLYSSDEDLTNKDYGYVSANVTLLSDALSNISAANNTFNLAITDINRNQTIYIKAFVWYGNTTYSTGATISKVLRDETALTDITGLVINAGDSQNTISWYNPNTTSDADFAKVQIFRKVGIYPDGDNDLEKVYESINKNVGNLNAFIDTGLTNNVVYYYLFKLLDTSGNVNINTKFTSTPTPLPIYGIQYDSATKTWTRLGLASSMSATDFNSISPYRDIKRVLLTDAKSKTYLKSTDSTLKEDGTSATLDGTLGNVFSEFPKTYYKYENSGTIHKWYIANSAVGGCTPHKAFIRNSVTKDYLYMGCYKGYVNGTKLESRSGILPTVTGKSFADFRTLAEARGTGFTQFDSLSLHLLQVLFLIQYGNADFSTTLNSGQDIGTILTSGGSNSLGNSTGVVGNYSSLYGIENLVGGSHNVVDGLIAGSKYWQSNNNFESMTSESSTGTYSQLSATIPSSTNGFVSDIEPLDSVIIGKTMTGSSSDGFNDYQISKNGSNLNVMLLGGSSLVSQRGLFNNEFVDVTNMGTTTNMTSEGTIDTYAVWSYTLDRSALGIKTVSSYSLVDGTTPAITANLSINNLSGRLIVY